MTVAGVVLAGGASRRMGQDKATMTVGGAALAARVLAAAVQVADPVVLVAPAGHPARALVAPGAGPVRPGHPLGVPRTPPAWPPPAVGIVTDPGRGPLAAMAAALAALGTRHVLVLAGDHPALRVGLLARLVELREQAQAVACRRGPRLEPLVAVYERLPALAAAGIRLAAADHSLMGLLVALPTLVVEEVEWRRLDPEGRSFVDLDDPAGVAAWRSGPDNDAPPPPTEG